MIDRLYRKGNKLLITNAQNDQSIDNKRMMFDEIVFVPSKEHKWCIMITKMIIVRLSLSVCEQSRNMRKKRILKDRMTFLGDNLTRHNKNEKKLNSMHEIIINCKYLSK